MAPHFLTTMLQLQNRTPFASSLSVLPDPDGVDTLYVVVKGTFVLVPRTAIASVQDQPAAKDLFAGDPATSSLRTASDVHLGKPGTDVVMMGTAVSPNGRPLPEMLVALSVAKRRKVVRVIGDRCWKPRGAGFSAAKPFDAMPLVYERAFGGTHRLDDGHVVATDQRNPVGTGFAGQRSPNDMGGRSLPNLEDPRRPIQYATDQPPPACFGFVAPSWMPRRMYAGTYDDAWRRDRAPYLPLDFDRHFFNVAPADMTFARPLQGGEPVEVDGAGRRGPLRFALPQVCPAVAVQIAGARHAAPAALETVLIEADDGRLGLTWRAAVPCDKSALKIQAVVIEMSESR